ncbi:MAG: RNA-binding protein [Desulfitobacteriaceae bacterium]|nr:RNA-binding protein [Desulfitobacteriaceae bacterium]MDI6879205.1 RNA-binding protein [Desulfitobacteriaceae bacterium]MDI6914148.1 RNA-binding protein [Desulfitobacteriaceae bacterium]
MTETLYVGNLPWNTSAEELTAFFGEYGEVLSSRIITDRETGRSRGFGFVEVGDGDAARLAQDLNGKDFGGRPLTVNEAKPKQF